MAAKNFFILLLTILTIAESELSPVTTTGDDVRSTVVHETTVLMQTVLRRVAEEMKNVVDLAEETIKHVVESIVEEGKRVLQSVEDTSETLIASVVSEMRRAMNESVAVGVDISECVSGQEEAAEEAVEEITKEIRACVSDQVSGVEQKRQEVLDLIENAVQFAKVARDNITSCLKLSAPLQVLNCVVQKALYVTKEANSIGNSIRNKIREVATFVLHAVPNVSRCAVTKLQTAQQRVAEIVRNITHCLNGRIRH